MRNIIERIEAALQKHEISHGAKANGLRLGRKELERLNSFAVKHPDAARGAIRSCAPPYYNGIPIEEMDAEWYLTAVAPGAECCGHAQTMALIRRGSRIEIRRA